MSGVIWEKKGLAHFTYLTRYTLFDVPLCYLF
jgi:hypothetical protein